jgi:hypothetical protein
MTTYDLRLGMIFDEDKPAALAASSRSEELKVPGGPAYSPEDSDLRRLLLQWYRRARQAQLQWYRRARQAQLTHAEALLHRGEGRPHYAPKQRGRLLRRP